MHKKHIPDGTDPLMACDLYTSCLKRSSVSLLLNVPIGKVILLVIAPVAKFSLIHWYVRPGVITNVVLQDLNDVKIHQKMIKSVIPNYVVSTRVVSINILSDTPHFCCHLSSNACKALLQFL
jgi:hypothetical protein